MANELKDTIIKNNLHAETLSVSDSLTYKDVDFESKLKYIDDLESKFENIINGYYSLTVTPTAGTNYTINSAGVSLFGNSLRITFNATRSSATSGNISNETVCTLQIDTGGKIKGGLNVAFTSSSTGANGSFYTRNFTISDNIMSIEIVATAYAASTTSTNAYFVVPVRLNIDAY